MIRVYWPQGTIIENVNNLKRFVYITAKVHCDYNVRLRNVPSMIKQNFWKTRDTQEHVKLFLKQFCIIVVRL